MKKVILTLAAVAMFAGMTSCTCCQKSEKACECENCTECCQADTVEVADTVVAADAVVAE